MKTLSRLPVLLVPLALTALVACSRTEPPANAPSEAPKDAPAAPAAATSPASTADHDHVCPMHPEVTSKGPSKCPKCGMDLVPMKASAAPTVKITTTPAKPKAGEKTKLVFEISDGGTKLSSFDVVHEKQLHLLMVTPDLAWFAHEHPEPKPDGTFDFEFTFPHGGSYRLFSDFKATGKPGAVVPVDIEVDGAPAPKVPLAPTNLVEARTVGDYQVRLTSPVPPAGASSTLKFLVVKDKKPVTDLEQYLGALGHLVIINEDGKTFLHSHPDDHSAPHDDTGKPPHAHPKTGEVGFGTLFPKPGLYKAWAQFLHKGKNITADFVLDVKPGAAGTAPAAADGHGAHQH